MITLLLLVSLNAYTNLGMFIEYVNDASNTLRLGYVHTRVTRTTAEPLAWSKPGAAGQRTVHITSLALNSKDDAWLRHTAYHEVCHLWLHMQRADYKDEALVEMCADALEMP